MMLRNLLIDEEGVLTFEWILLLTILVIGAIAGLAAVRDALDVELCDISEGIMSINQEYVMHGIMTHVVWTGIYDDGQDDNPIFVEQNNGPHYVNPSEFDDTDSGSGAPHVDIVAKEAHGLDGDDAPLDDGGH